jgi:hypothetical protein
MLIVFFGGAIVLLNSAVKLNAAFFERKVTSRLVLKHIGIMILTAIVAILILWSIHLLPKSLRF